MLTTGPESTGRGHSSSAETFAAVGSAEVITDRTVPLMCFPKEQNSKEIFKRLDLASFVQICSHGEM